MDYLFVRENLFGDQLFRAIISKDRLPFQQSQEFIARNKQLASKRTASTQLSPLDQAVNAEVMDAKQIGGFLN